MIYLFKNPTDKVGKPVKVIQMSGNLHEDNLKDIDNRTEPMEQSMKPVPPADMYPQDPTTDPDIEQRQQTTNDFPSFVFIEYKLSPVDFWGKKWKDAKEHLIPKNSTVQAVMDIHIEGEKTLGKMIDLAFADSNKANVKIMLDAYTTMFAGMDKQYVFPHMQALSNMTQNALADRAFQKHNYMMAASRLDEQQEEPEWFANMRLRMIEAATMAGTYCRVHSEMWQLLEWKNNPTYGNVANGIKLRLVNQAKWLEDRFAPDTFVKPKISDHHATALMC